MRRRSWLVGAVTCLAVHASLALRPGGSHELVAAGAAPVGAEQGL